MRFFVLEEIKRANPKTAEQLKTFLEGAGYDILSDNENEYGGSIDIIDYYESDGITYTVHYSSITDFNITAVESDG